MEWNRDASELANGYMDDVRRACVERGLDPEPAASRVYERILTQVLASGVEVVSADLIRGILVAAGPAAGQVSGSVPPPLPRGGGAAGPVVYGSMPAPRAPEKWKGSSSAAMGCVVAGAVGFGLFMFLGILAAILLPALARSREAAWRASCQNNLKQIGVLLQMHANEHGGRYPNWVNDPGYLIFSPEVLAGNDTGIFQCPSEDTNFAGEQEDGSFSLDSDYLYLGFALRSQEDMNALVKEASNFDYDLEAFCAQFEVSGAEGAISPLRANLPDPASIPVLVEWDANHQYRGAHVAYLDGHVEFIKFGEKFPVTQEFYDAATELLN